ncbi:hypothetical protein NQ317_014563 [Molorchus minor]|uniref:Uncharacterized protein n=1 Tax=Molorchus minor TaxID=1323400 RepID=A0ABQ9JTB7_9CUCU|nr:hypothetical protein NQ317_014563 [Molorchus minor]
MIEAMLNVENNQDITQMRRISSKKNQKIFTRQKFIAEAPDHKYLMFEAVAVMDILGACRREELCQITLRPAHVNHQRLFVKYTSNKCTIQPVRIGINIFGKMPTDIARFLKLPNSELYT